MGLLPRMEAIVGKRTTSYRYHPKGGKPIPLGTDRIEAIRKVLDLLGRAPDTGTVKWVWEKYKAHPRFLKRAEATREDYEQCAVQILAVLGSMPIGSIDTATVTRYIHVERADSPSRANHEKALLSNLFSLGVLLGVCKSNPAKEVPPHETEPRTEAPDPLLLARFLRWVSEQTPQRRIIGLAASYASLAGNRKVEFLDLAWPQVDLDAGQVRVKRAKQRGKKRGEVVEVIAITPALRACLEELKALRRGDCLYVFPTRDNNAYSARGFKTLWQRIVLKAIAEKVIPAEARFTFHDLRAYYATAHKEQTGELPDLHKNPETTARVYDRTKVVKRSAL
jgi:integrase